MFHPGGFDQADAPTVVLGDDHAEVRIDIRDALEHEGFSVVAEAATAEQAVAAALRYRPQVCLLDVDMPGGGIVAADRIISRLPDTKIAMLSGPDPEEHLLPAILAGADGYLPKSIELHGLSVALTALLNGEAALPRALTARLMTEVRKSGQATAPTTQRRTFRSHLLYLPRLLRHFARRMRSGMALPRAWQSARGRMGRYH